jgi:mono/diheme cytochrome c family protein
MTARRHDGKREAARPSTVAGVALFLLTQVLAAADLPPAVDRKVDFVADVRPILAIHCFACHGPTKQKSGLRLDVKTAALAGGDNGKAIVPGKSADSPLVRQVAGIAEPVMPPGDERLSAADVGVLRAWIDQGANWPDSADGPRANPKDWWSLKPLARPAVPGTGHPIDQFIRSALGAKGMKPSPRADRRTLIRRLYFDLIGLPPTPDEVDAFVADGSPNAYEALVDRLLASPHYGERWARHWLDVVHYGDTHGYDKDKPRPNAWPYRDYVIRSFNADKPYGQFVREQIAGDVLFPGSADGIEALGFLSAGPWDFIGHAELPETKIDGQVARHLDRDDMVTNTVQTFMSLTVQCAQCHNHKFDPITQEDYYSLQTVFAAIDRTDRAYDRDPAIAARRAELERRKKELFGATVVAFEFVGPPTEPDQANAAAITENDRQLKALPPPSVVYCGAVHTGGSPFTGTGASGGKPRAIHVLPRGDVTKPGKLVGPGAVVALDFRPARFVLPTTNTEADRRAALAEWIADRDNPLAWRSIVNRDWRYHFGRGLVDTPNDFGRMGQLPTHPELLDWLAVEFRDGGQSLKQLHRLIVTSETYQQSSTGAEFTKADAENAYYWRMTRRKLDAESVRDAILSVSDQLDPRLYGPAFQDFVIDKPEHSPHYEYDRADPDDPRLHRRSVYRFLVRSRPQPFMTALDCADPSMQVDKRNESVSAPQALALLNNGFVLAMAKHFAARVEKMALDTPGRVTAAVRLALGRSPGPAELDALSQYADRHGLANLCRLLFNLNEFAFVD